MLIRLENFGGMIPLSDPHLLPNSAAVTANNCKLVSGALEAWRAPATVNTPSKAGEKKTIFKYGNFWLHWLEEVSVIRGPIAQDPYDRIYWTGEGVPKVSANDVVTSGGGTGYPTVSYSLGVPAPLLPPSVAVVGTPTTTDPTKAESRSYVFTYVTKYGEQGPPSHASARVDVLPGQSVEITELTPPPGGSHVITQKKIYRAATGSFDTEFQLVDTIAAAQTTYSDIKDSDALTIILPSAEWDPPPADMKGMILHPSGFAIGFSGKEVCFSEPSLLHAWPVAYRSAVDSEIVAGAVFGTSAVVVTKEGFPYVFTGEVPGSMSREKLEDGQSCMSPRSMVDMGYMALWAAPDGLMGVGTGKFGLATEKILSRDDWQALNPSSIHGYCYAGCYIGFYDNGNKGGFAFDPRSGAFSLFDLHASAGYSDRATGDLYLMVGSNIVKWDAGATFIPYLWESKPFRAPADINLGAGQVFAEEYPVTVKIIVDGSVMQTKSVQDNRIFRLLSGFRGRDWKVQVEGTKTVSKVLLASTPRELSQGA